MTTADLVALLVAVVAVVLGLTALLLGFQVRAVTRRAAGRRESAPEVPGERRRAAVVVNPSKFADVAPVRTALERVCAQDGWAPPLWLETTVHDPGLGQARAALAAGVDLVVACGGDGTVRHVAEALAGSGTPMGLISAGTGNLLARNLDFPSRRSLEMSAHDAAAALRVALVGQTRPIDVGWIRVVPVDGLPRPERAFMVMAGMGFDAEIMEGVPDDLKAKVGVMAYFVSGLRQFNGDRVRMTVTIDGVVHHRRVRTVVVGNVGRVQGGLALMPDAEVDDGYLDVLAIGPRGLLGWLDVAARIITRHRRRDTRLAHWRGQRIDLVPDAPEQAQIDGDPVGTLAAMHLRVDEGALLVRVAPDEARPTLRGLASAGFHAGLRAGLDEHSDRISRRRPRAGATATGGPR